ncbi:MAG: ferredoxin [Motilibacteraceae bacterium]
MPYVITAACIDVRDRTCIEECPVDCIYVGARKLYVNPKECIDCGACEPVCPVEAIVQDRHVLEEDAQFIEEDRLFFTEVLPGRSEPIGSPGGYVKVGDLDVDTPFVAAHPGVA